MACLVRPAVADQGSSLCLQGPLGEVRPVSPWTWPVAECPCVSLCLPSRSDEFRCAARIGGCLPAAFDARRRHGVESMSGAGGPGIGCSDLLVSCAFPGRANAGGRIGRGTRLCHGGVHMPGVERSIVPPWVCAAPGGRVAGGCMRGGTRLCRVGSAPPGAEIRRPRRRCSRWLRSPRWRGSRREHQWDGWRLRV